MSRAEKEELRRTIRLVIRLRFVVVPAVLLLIVLSGLGGIARGGLTAGSLPLHAVNAVVVLGLNLLCLRLASSPGRNLRPLVLFQLAIDALNFTFTLYKTGGVASPLSFLYFGVVFAAGLLLGGRGTFAVAGVCAVLYLGVVWLDSSGILPHQSFFLPLEGLQIRPAYVALSVLCTLFALTLFAFLATHVAAELRRRNTVYRHANSRLEKQLATLRLLQRTIESLNSSRGPRAAADRILGDLLGFLHLDRALLYLAEGGRTLRLFMVKYRDGVPAVRRVPPQLVIALRGNAGLTARVALRRTAVNIRRPEDSPLINRELQKKIGDNPFALAPLVVRGRLVGVLGVDRSIASGHISDEEFQVVCIFAAQAAITINGLRG